jgi:hypothetical protein
MKYSQYLYDYLKCNTERGWGNGLTPSTYLTYHLHGKAREWSGRYTKSLIYSLQSVGAVIGPSKGGYIAYYDSNVYTVYYNKYPSY